MTERTFLLGGPGAERDREDELRDGALVFRSPKGLARPQALLIEALPKRPDGRALFGMDTEGAVALAARALWPEAPCHWFHLEAYPTEKVRNVLYMNGVEDVPTDALEDVPDGPFGLIALPFPSAGDALLMRDLIEAAHDALAVGGRLVASTNGKPDALRAVLKKVFGKSVPAPAAGSKRARKKQGTCLYATRTRERDVRRDRSHVLAARFEHAGGDVSEIGIETRPGTFSHGSVDRGTRALAEWWEPRGEDAVLDLGAGCGALGLLAAQRLPAARVVLVDSNARAVGCARRNAERNGLAERTEVLLRADFEDLPPGPGDGYALCLANPPYFGGFRIARSFVETAHRLLRPGGRLALVSRAGAATERHLEVVGDVFAGATPHERGDYVVVEAVR